MDFKTFSALTSHCSGIWLLVLMFRRPQFRRRRQGWRRCWSWSGVEAPKAKEASQENGGTESGQHQQFRVWEEVWGTETPLHSNRRTDLVLLIFITSHHHSSFNLCKSEGRPTAACVVTRLTCSQDVSEYQAVMMFKMWWQYCRLVFRPYICT